MHFKNKFKDLNVFFDSGLRPTFIQLDFDRSSSFTKFKVKTQLMLEYQKSHKTILQAHTNI